jgi:Tol biopolymer transport system component
MGPVRTAIGLPAGESLNWDSRPAAISPDGRRIAYVGRSEDGTQLFHKALDQLDGVPIPGTANAARPFFSPDGTWIGFFDLLDMALKKVPVTGGGVEQIAYIGAASLFGAHWAPNDSVYFMDSAALEIEKVAASGGTPVAVADVRGSRPTLLPDMKTILVAAEGDVIALDLESGERTILVDDAAGPEYANSGHLLYVRSDSSLYVAPFDLDEVRVTGSEVRVTGGVAMGGDGSAGFWLSDEGTLLYLQDGGSLGRTIVSVSRDGVEQAIPGVDCDCWNPQYSPDGQRLLYEQDLQVWVYDFRWARTRTTEIFGRALVAGGESSGWPRTFRA